MADAINAGLINDEFHFDYVHPTDEGHRAFAFMIAHKYADFFHFDNVPSPYQKWTGENNIPDTDRGYIWNEGWESATFDAAGNVSLTRDDPKARSPVLIFNGAPGSTPTFQLTTTAYRQSTKPSDVVKTWLIWNKTTDASSINIAVYDYPDGVTLTLVGTVGPIASGTCRTVMTDGTSVVLVD